MNQFPDEHGDQEHGIRIWREGRGRATDLPEGRRKAARQDRTTGRGAGFFGRCLQSHPRHWRQKAVNQDHPDLIALRVKSESLNAA